jgi:hypothetical protein
MSSSLGGGEGVTELTSTCGRCLVSSQVPASATSWTCESCGSYFTFQPCRRCGAGVQVREGADKAACPACGKRHKPVLLRQTAYEAVDSGPSQAAAAGPVDPNAHRLAGCVVLGGYGHPFAVRATVALDFGDTAVEISTRVGSTWSLGYEAISELEVDGRGAVRAGGGFFGGGFGAQGAAEGMMIASVLNSLTSKTEIETLVNITAAEAALFLFCGHSTPDVIRRDLAVVQARIDAAHSPAGPTRSVGLAGELLKLDELRKSGALTDDEFAAAKQALIAGFRSTPR